MKKISSSENPDLGPKPLAALYLHENTPHKEVVALEKWRVRFESENGPTDPTKYYSSMRPLEEQQWLIKNFPEIWFNGLPPFIQQAITGSLQKRSSEGKLDDEPDAVISAWCQGKLRRSEPQR